MPSSSDIENKEITTLINKFTYYGLSLNQNDESLRDTISACIKGQTKRLNVASGDDGEVNNDEIMVILFHNAEFEDLAKFAANEIKNHYQERIKDLYYVQIVETFKEVMFAKNKGGKQLLNTTVRKVRKILTPARKKKDSNQIAIVTKEDNAQLIHNDEMRLLKNYHFDAFRVHSHETSNQDDASINVTSRIRSLEQSVQLKDGIMTGRVFTARLSDLVQLYQQIGDSLFDSNLRYGIENKLDVDSAIRNTLTRPGQPPMFWFLNNGISLVVPKEASIDLHHPNQVVIKNVIGSHVSVINGAQTITAAAFAEDSHDSTVPLHIPVNVEVLLRIYSFDSSFENSQRDERKEVINQITVALNRQKPINPEDVAYTSIFVNFVNSELPASAPSQWKNGGPFEFSLVRRGDPNSENEHAHLLLDFSKLVLAYVAQKPGSARAKGRASLLKMDENLKMLNEEIFLNQDRLEDWLASDQKIDPETDVENGNTEKGQDESDSGRNENGNLEDIFFKYYKPVNFVFSLQKILETKEFKNKLIARASKLTNTEDLNTLLNNGNTLLIALFMREHSSLTSSKDPEPPMEFTDWKYEKVVRDSEKADDGNALSEEELTKDMNKYLKWLDDFLSEYQGKSIDANTFKNEKFYNDFIRYRLTQQPE